MMLVGGARVVLQPKQRHPGFQKMNHTTAPPGALDNQAPALRPEQRIRKRFDSMCRITPINFAMRPAVRNRSAMLDN